MSEVKSFLSQNLGPDSQAKTKRLFSEHLSKYTQTRPDGIIISPDTLKNTVKIHLPEGISQLGDDLNIRPNSERIEINFHNSPETAAVVNDAITRLHKTENLVPSSVILTRPSSRAIAGSEQKALAV